MIGEIFACLPKLSSLPDLMLNPGGPTARTLRALIPTQRTPASLSRTLASYQRRQEEMNGTAARIPAGEKAGIDPRHTTRFLRMGT